MSTYWPHLSDCFSMHMLMMNPLHTPKLVPQGVVPGPIFFKAEKTLHYFYWYADDAQLYLAITLDETSQLTKLET